MDVSILGMILSSSIVAAIIAGIVATRNQNIQNRSAQISQNRNEFREKVKEIAVDIEIEKDPEKLRKTISQLKMRLNGYGQEICYEETSNKNPNISKDEHIWLAIQDFESAIEENDVQRIDALRKKTVQFIIIWMKYDWEKTKREVENKNYSMPAFLFTIVAICFLGIYCAYSYLGYDARVIEPDTGAYIVDNAYVPMTVQGFLIISLLVFASFLILDFSTRFPSEKFGGVRKRDKIEMGICYVIGAGFAFMAGMVLLLVYDQNNDLVEIILKACILIYLAFSVGFGIYKGTKKYEVPKEYVKKYNAVAERFK